MVAAAPLLGASTRAEQQKDYTPEQIAEFVIRRLRQPGPFEPNSPERPRARPDLAR